MSLYPTRKPRSDARLKTLPVAQQEDIVAFARENSLRQTVQWLEAQDVRTSVGSLSAFLSWHRLEHEFRQLRLDTETFRKLLTQEQPGLAPEEVERLGTAYFTMQAIKRNHAPTFVAVAAARNHARLETEKLELRRREVARKEAAHQLAVEKHQTATCELFLRWYADQRAREIASSPAANAEKIARLRRTFFADVDRLDDSGQVKLPPLT